MNFIVIISPCEWLLHGLKQLTSPFTTHTHTPQVEPSFLQISSIPQIPKVEKLLVLCCRVENFYPQHVDLEWSRNDGEQVHTVTNFGPFSDHNSLYSVWSEIQLVMAREDERAVYTCRVYHSSFPPLGYKDVLYHINTQGTPPNVMFINCEPRCPLLNEELTLHLCIKDFCPEDVSVTWTKDGETIHSGVFNTPPSLNINGLYSIFSFLKLTPNNDDRGSKLRCRVVHSAQREPEERLFTLQLTDGCWCPHWVNWFCKTHCGMPILYHINVLPGTRLSSYTLEMRPNFIKPLVIISPCDYRFKNMSMIFHYFNHSSKTGFVWLWRTILEAPIKPIITIVIVTITIS